MKFTITVLQKDQVFVAAKMSQLPHVKMLETRVNSGTVHHESVLEFSFEPVKDSDKVEITVIKNPHNVPEAQIKAHLEDDIKLLLLK